MNRRELLQLMGCTLTAQVLTLGRELHARAAGVGGLQVLNPHQGETVATIAELIIPQTDTPGARAARVGEFIDLVLAEWCDDAERERFLKGLGGVDARSGALFGRDFLGCDAAQQAQLLTALDAEVTRLRDADREDEVSNDFFHMMKRLTLLGYYTSEVGATQELHEQIIPGRYDPCYSLVTGGR